MQNELRSLNESRSACGSAFFFQNCFLHGAGGFFCCKIASCTLLEAFFVARLLPACCGRLFLLQNGFLHGAGERFSCKTASCMVRECVLLATFKETALGSFLV